MNETSDEPPLSDRIRSWARSKAHASNFNPFGANDTNASRPSPPLRKISSAQDAGSKIQHDGLRKAPPKDENTHTRNSRGLQDVVDKRSPNIPPPAPPPQVAKEGNGEKSPSIGEGGNDESKPNVFIRFYFVGKKIILSSWVNWLLVFVPVGVAVGAMFKAMGDRSPISPTIVFAMNAIAIIPLAGMLSYATESVASKLGDTIGALMNVTFGNAVELIIFIIALVAKEIRIVQASLLGSILANLLLILGMCFLFGGLRFREQLYNSTVTQMSACLLSLSVMSLLLPTAFHASFSNLDLADRVVIKVSRGTSVVLLLVYVLYLLFQLKSHAYMYESTPQHMIDEESHPGVLADMLNSSSSSDTSSSDSDSHSDSSSGSHKTTKMIKRALRRKRRKSSASSKDKDNASKPSVVRRQSSHSHQLIDSPAAESPSEFRSVHTLEAVVSGDEADTDGERHNPPYGARSPGVISRDFETEPTQAGSRSRSSSDKGKKKKCRRKHKKSKRNAHEAEHEKEPTENVEPVIEHEKAEEEEPRSKPPRVDFVSEVEEDQSNSPKRPFNIRHLSSVRPALPKVLSSAVFTQVEKSAGHSLPLPTVQAVATRAGSSSGSGLRRTNSLPDRLNKTVPSAGPLPTSAQPLPYLMPVTRKAPASVDSSESNQETKHLSRNSAIALLLISTGLVAVCAEFLVDSIDSFIESTGVSQAFIGLIILPIVGNAAEHVTAVTVASKNKMDLAIGVALGSSIQIALFVTPVIVLLGWALGTEMSLYFSLFETVSLFVSAFIVNYLMIDGRSNYLEGALLIAAYVIIAVAAYFYPACENLSTASGPSDGTQC